MIFNISENSSHISFYHSFARSYFSDAKGIWGVLYPLLIWKAGTQCMFSQKSYNYTLIVSYSLQPTYLPIYILLNKIKDIQKQKLWKQDHKQLRTPFLHTVAWYHTSVQASLCLHLVMQINLVLVTSNNSYWIL